MSTVFFVKKSILYRALYVILAFFVLFTIAYAEFLRAAKVLSFEKSFYFLVMESTSAEVGIFEAQLGGGAGFLLEKKDKEYVALHVYFNKKDGLSVEKRLQNEGRNVCILPVKIEALYFKGYEEKKKAAFYKNALENVYAYMKLLGEEIGRLEEGATQRSCGNILRIIARNLNGLFKEYQESYPHCALVCQKIATALENIVEEVIYVKDLRYLLCDFVETYLFLLSQFAL